MPAPTPPSRPDRRTLIAGALAAAAGAAVATAADASPASAVDPNDVVLGGENVTATTTRIAIQEGVAATTALHVTVPYASTGTAANLVGGVVAVRANGTAVGVDAYGGRAAVLATVGSSTTTELDSPVALYAIGGVAAVDGLFPKGTEGIGARLSGDRAPLLLEPHGGTGAPTSGPHRVGELVVDRDGRLYICRANGTPGIWSELTATASPRFVLLPTPERFVDTRTGLGGVTGPVAAGTESAISLTGRRGALDDPALVLPDGATAIVGNLSVLGAAGAPAASYVTLWPQGPRPATASITYGPSSVISNAVTVALAATGDGHRGLRVYAHGACDYVLDVTGYHVEG